MVQMTDLETNFAGQD